MGVHQNVDAAIYSYNVRTEQGHFTILTSENPPTLRAGTLQFLHHGGAQWWQGGPTLNQWLNVSNS